MSMDWVVLFAERARTLTGLVFLAALALMAVERAARRLWVDPACGAHASPFFFEHLHGCFRE